LKFTQAAPPQQSAVELQLSPRSLQPSIAAQVLAGGPLAGVQVLGARQATVGELPAPPQQSLLLVQATPEALQADGTRNPRSLM
jgi:hypothetical protein